MLNSVPPMERQDPGGVSPSMDPLARIIIRRILPEMHLVRVVLVDTIQVNHCFIKNALNKLWLYAR